MRQIICINEKEEVNLLISKLSNMSTEEFNNFGNKYQIFTPRSKDYLSNITGIFFEKGWLAVFVDETNSNKYYRILLEKFKQVKLSEI